MTPNLTGQYVTRSAEETFELGQKIGEQLSGKATFLLSGDLGAGKTLFTKGLAAGLDIPPEDVTSPSFTLVNIHEGRARLYHIDLYRLESGACQEIGLDEILEDDDAVIVIEWAERLGRLPDAAVLIEIEYLSDSERRLTVSQPL
ncbi:MAG TPA: tRNA (adenosine(37)-N6)-threonylcarbamoyltransferase complex ATPase subunit type 1 TsaE [Blastocatellia bacterium]|nr:tRNA (adenosine(37)-N6)-threonylcarbamoyltransferase complex ATPase subunit type 1 TsaE [Blastocatellia bacterium]